MANGSSSSKSSSPRVVLCPYCGHTQPQNNERCASCGGLFEALSLKATQAAMGPWFIRDKSMPFRPGCSYETLVRMASIGRITATTVLRGPTTHQFWSIARNVPGVSHLVGYCYNCRAHVDAKLPACPKCSTKFGRVRARNELGLQFQTRKQAEMALKQVERARAGETDDGEMSVDDALEKALEEDMAEQGRPDLLSQVLDLPGLGESKPDGPKAQTLDFNPSGEATSGQAADSGAGMKTPATPVQTTTGAGVLTAAGTGASKPGADPPVQPPAARVKPQAASGAAEPADTHGTVDVGWQKPGWLTPGVIALIVLNVLFLAALVAYITLWL